MSITEASASGAAGKFVTTAPSRSLWGSPTFMERRWARKLDQERGRGCLERPGLAPWALVSRLAGGGRVPSPSGFSPSRSESGPTARWKNRAQGEVEKRPPHAPAPPRRGFPRSGSPHWWRRQEGQVPGGSARRGVPGRRCPLQSLFLSTVLTMDNGLSFSPFLPPSLSFLLSFKISRDYSL